MGLGTTASVPYGIAGIGYHHLVSQHRTEEETYHNLPIRMYKQGLINTVAYSLWMSDLRKNHSIPPPDVSEHVLTDAVQTPRRGACCSEASTPASSAAP